MSDITVSNNNTILYTSSIQNDIIIDNVDSIVINDNSIPTVLASSNLNPTVIEVYNNKGEKGDTGSAGADGTIITSITNLEIDALINS